jgi:8-oxo-dGTP pyrophosphatase MutT (NUDIX family)
LLHTHALGLHALKKIITDSECTQREVSNMLPAATHAGSVVFRTVDGSTRYLIVSSSNGLHWVLPKGHIEPEESEEAAALRELQEEAGFDGQIMARLALQSRQQSGQAVRVQYFLVRAGQRGAAAEQRQVLWEEEAAALVRLSFEDGRRALREAAGILRREEG